MWGLSLLGMRDVGTCSIIPSTEDHSSDALAFVLVNLYICRFKLNYATSPPVHRCTDQVPKQWVGAKNKKNPWLRVRMHEKKEFGGSRYIEEGVWMI